MERLAGSMKERIEGELTYPGTIDVTVIRRVVAEVTARFDQAFAQALSSVSRSLPIRTFPPASTQGSSHDQS